MLAIIRTILTGYRRKGTLWQFVGLGGLIALISIIAVSISLGQNSKVMSDIWLAGIEMVGLISVIFFVATARKKSRQDHSIHLLLTHYHHRVSIYIAYILAYIILIAALYLILTAIALLTMRVVGHPPVTGFLIAVGLSLVKMIGLTSVARLLGSVTSGYIASILTLIIYIIGHSTGFVVYHFMRQQNTIATRGAKLIYYIFPNFQALDAHSVVAQTTSSLDITRGIIIMIAYSISMVTIGSYIICHQEL